MIYDINQELRDFIYITSVYKCITSYNLKGHQIGRKIGDMLEILTMHAIYKCPQLLTCLDIESKLEGYTTAGHKVEFGFYHDKINKQGLFGAIECKCVGVEETKAGKNANYLRNIGVNESFAITLDGHWMDRPINQTVSVLSCNDASTTIKMTNSQNNEASIITMPIGSNIKLVIDENQQLLHTSPNGNMLVEIPGIIRICKTIKLDEISNSICRFSLYNCLPGPQTIEKAKQASLVAMDLRKRIDGCWGKEELSPAEKTMNFIHVMCEFSHWEQKSKNVISSCIDHNVIVADAVIIKAFEIFESVFGEAHMLDAISKNNYIKNELIQNAVETVFAEFDNHVFYDIVLQSYVNFGCENDMLIITPI